MERRVPCLLHHQPGQQRPHRSAQRHHRTPPTPRPRIQKPRELPTTNAPGLRGPHPQQTPMSPFGTPVRLIWRRRRWICPEERCPGGTIAEDVPELVEGGAKLTVRAVWWAIGQMRREHGTVEGIARQLGVDWHTLWAHVQPKLTDMANDPTRLEGVTGSSVSRVR